MSSIQSLGYSASGTRMPAVSTLRFGVSTHLFHDQRLDRDHLVEIAAHGIDCIELFATRTHFDYHDGVGRSRARASGSRTRG